ncbi:hypothetical protein ACQVPY_15540 [Bacillus pretiosus]|uniref:hypothetical protein n=1 Tax=Bacillus pretiosus TaxID=2983392 RepID=UPI003D645922
MYKKITLSILTTGIMLLGSKEAFASENANNSMKKELSKNAINSIVKELSIPIGHPYYLPTKIDANGNNTYKYKFNSQNPSGDWEVNISNGEVVCGVEGIMIAEIYNEHDNLIYIYKITAGGI